MAEMRQEAHSSRSIGLKQYGSSVRNMPAALRASAQFRAQETITLAIDKRVSTMRLSHLGDGGGPSGALAGSLGEITFGLPDSAAGDQRRGSVSSSLSQRSSQSADLQFPLTMPYKDQVVEGCLSVFNDMLDGAIDRFVLTHLTALTAPPFIAMPGRCAALKLVVSTFLLIAWLVLMAACGSWFCGIDYFRAFYGAFQSVSTIGFGDVYCGYETSFKVLGQALLILPGMVVFSEYAGALSDAIKLLLAGSRTTESIAAGGAPETTADGSRTDTRSTRADNARNTLGKRVSSVLANPQQGRRYNSLVEIQITEDAGAEAPKRGPPITGNDACRGSDRRDRDGDVEGLRRLSVQRV